MLYGELSKKMTAERRKTVHLLNRIFDKARNSKEPTEHRIDRVVELTRGQVIALKNVNAKLIMKDDQGEFYLDVDDNMRIKEVRLEGGVT